MAAPESVAVRGHVSGRGPQAKRSGKDSPEGGVPLQPWQPVPGRGRRLIALNEYIQHPAHVFHRKAGAAGKLFGICTKPALQLPKQLDLLTKT